MNNLQTIQGQVTCLSGHLTALPQKDRDFANSLMAAWGRYGRLSQKQEYWLGVLVTRATSPAPTKQEVAVGNFAGVIGLFNHAKQHLKFPKIRLQLAKAREHWTRTRSRTQLGHETFAILDFLEKSVAIKGYGG